MRDVAGAGQLAVADLVEDLARLLVAPGVLLRSLVPGEQLQGVGARRDGFTESSWCDGDEGVAPEQRHVPGDARREDPLSLRRARGQRADVADAALQQLVEQLVVGDHLRGVPLPVLVGAAQLVHRDVELERAAAPGRRRSGPP